MSAPPLLHHPGMVAAFTLLRFAILFALGRLLGQRARARAQVLAKLEALSAEPALYADPSDVIVPLRRRRA